MTKIYTLLLLCLFALTLPVTAREAEFKKIKESWTLQADGTQVYRQSKVLTLYTHTAMNRTYGESFITYDPRYQTLQIHESYTRQKDGNIVKTPANALVEVLPSAAANAPAFNALREMVVVHTGLELGAGLFHYNQTGIFAGDSDLPVAGALFAGEGVRDQHHRSPGATFGICP